MAVAIHKPHKPVQQVKVHVSLPNVWYHSQLGETEAAEFAYLEFAVLSQTFKNQSGLSFHYVSCKFPW